MDDPVERMEVELIKKAIENIEKYLVFHSLGCKVRQAEKTCTCGLAEAVVKGIDLNLIEETISDIRSSTMQNAVNIARHIGSQGPYGF